MEASRSAAPSDRDAGAAGLFASLGDPARLAILRELAGGTTCACELSPKLAMAPNLLSYHLRILREAGLVEGRRRGRRIDYRVRSDGLERATVEIVRLAAGGGDEG